MVVVGFTEQDILLALGVTPVATTEWYGEQPYAVWPWATAELGDAKPEVIKAPDKLPLEQIAALTPDLIIGTNAGLTKEVYASLTKIAPTIANSGKYDSDWFEPWPTQTVMVGKALGKEAEAQRLVDELAKRFADEAAAHPQFAEVPAIFLQAPYYEGNAIAYQDGLSTDFLTDLGFVIPKELDAVRPGGGPGLHPGREAGRPERRGGADLGDRGRRGEGRAGEEQAVRPSSKAVRGRALALHRRRAGRRHLLLHRSEPAVRAGHPGSRAGEGASGLTATSGTAAADRPVRYWRA